jgi:hypothetical protein
MMNSGGYSSSGQMSIEPGMVGRIEFSIDANSSSFYSNNTSAAGSNLSNSRYLLSNKKKISKVIQGPQVGKVIPITKSIDNTVFQVG